MSRIDADSWLAIVGDRTEAQVVTEARTNGETVEQWLREAVRQFREACGGIDYDTDEHCSAYEMADEDIVDALAAIVESEVAS